MNLSRRPWLRSRPYGGKAPGRNPKSKIQNALALQSELFLQGAQDQYGARDTLQALFDGLPEPKRLVFVDGADHFFTGKLDRVEAALGQWLQERHRELKNSSP